MYLHSTFVWPPIIRSCHVCPPSSRLGVGVCCIASQAAGEDRKTWKLPLGTWNVTSRNEEAWANGGGEAIPNRYSWAHFLHTALVSDPKSWIEAGLTPPLFPTGGYYLVWLPSGDTVPDSVLLGQQWLYYSPCDFQLSKLQTQLLHMYVLCSQKLKSTLEYKTLFCWLC